MPDTNPHSHCSHLWNCHYIPGDGWCPLLLWPDLVRSQLQRIRVVSRQSWLKRQLTNVGNKLDLLLGWPHRKRHIRKNCERHCYSLNVCAPPRLTCEILTSKVMASMRGLGHEAFGRWLGHKGGDLINRIIALLKKDNNSIYEVSTLMT
jgi:hypothetical protein